MSALTVNIDLVSVLRSVRRLNEPDPAQAAVLCELAGADGVGVQVRRDRKYIRDRDLYILKSVVKTKLVCELPPADELIDLVLEVKPWIVILVADHADSDSPVSPIDFSNPAVDFGGLTDRFKGVGINVGFFVEPEMDDVKGAARAGAASVLINCSGFTDARTIEDAQSELDRIDRAVNGAAKQGLTVYAGRGITYKNIQPLVELGYIDEFIIGHAVNSRAMLVGYERAVKEMLTLTRAAKSGG